MPELEINLDALAHNLRLIRRQEQAWGFRFLPDKSLRILLYQGQILIRYLWQK